MGVGSAKEKLIEVADGLFYREGFHAVGLDRVIAEAGVTKTTFYNHFESKDDLIVAVLDARDSREGDEWLGIMRERGGGDARREILAMFDILDEWFARDDYRGCMFMRAASEFPQENDPIHLKALEHGAMLMREVRGMARRAGAKDAEGLAKQVMLLLTGALSARPGAQAREAAVVARGAAEAVLARGLG
jgi:AcrR family transcriptional regulator